MYCYVNNLDEWAMRQKLAVDGFKWKGKKSRSTQILKQNSNEGNNKGYILEAVNYPKHQQKIHIYLYFLPEIVKIDKYQKVVCNIYIYIYVYNITRNSLELWIDTRKNAKCNQIQSRSTVQFLHRHYHSL